MGTTVKIESLLETDQCLFCGIMFAMPLGYADQLRKEGTHYYCPSGHEQWYVVPGKSKGDDDDEGEEWKKPKSESSPTTELRRELVHALHRAEQAEAKAAEARDNKAPQIPSEHHKEKLMAERDASGNYVCCPKCNRPYKSLACLAKHLRTTHRVDFKDVIIRETKDDA